MSSEDQGAHVTGPAGGDPHASETPGRRLSHAVYAFEHAMVVTVLLMMVVTYILTVLWNNSHLPYDQFDQLILGIAGYETPQEAPQEVLATVAGVVSPIVLALVLLVLSYLAVRTREQATERLAAEGATPKSLGFFAPLLAPIRGIRSRFVRRLVFALIITAGMWGFVQIVAEVDSSLVCVIALALLGVGMVLRLRESGFGFPRVRGLIGFAGGVAVGAVLAQLMPDDLGGWAALGVAIVAAVALTVPVGDLVVGATAGLAVVPGIEAFLVLQIPGFIALALTFMVMVNFLGTHLASLAGGLVGGGLLLWYFLTKAGETYDWTSGLTAILLLYVGFLGASMATHDGHHITVDAVRKLIKSHKFHLYNAVGDILALLFTAFLGVMAIRYLFHMRAGADHHIPSDLPAWIAVVPIGFGFAMMSVRFAIRIAASLKSFRNREPAPELKPELH